MGAHHSEICDGGTCSVPEGLLEQQEIGADGLDFTAVDTCPDGSVCYVDRSAMSPYSVEATLFPPMTCSYSVFEAGESCAFGAGVTAGPDITVDPYTLIDVTGDETTDEGEDYLKCEHSSCVPAAADIQHVYNIVEVRHYITLSGKDVDCTASPSDKACISVSYPNWKTASTYKVDGSECASGICVNIASRMIQKEALHHAQCAYFVSIVVVQWADLVICKTRMNSIYHQGMLNPAMNFGLILETMLAAILCYTPGVTTALGTRPIKLLHWWPGCLYCILIFWYDETRKLWMRSTTTITEDEQTGQVTRDAGWMERNTYY